MNILKKLELELVRDWQKLQLEKIPALKAIALKAYYIKFSLYRKTRAWDLELQTAI